MYCSIEDAWGKDFNKLTTDSDNSKTSSISSNSHTDEYKNFIRLKEKFTDNSVVCTQTFTHINKCPSCQEKLKKMYGINESFNNNNNININSISKIILNKIKDNNDAVTLMLICFLIILLIKLFIS